MDKGVDEWQKVEILRKRDQESQTLQLREEKLVADTAPKDNLHIHVTQTISQKAYHTLDAAVTKASRFLLSCQIDRFRKAQQSRLVNSNGYHKPTSNTQEDNTNER